MEDEAIAPRAFLLAWVDQREGAAAGNLLSTTASSKVGRPRPDGDHPNMRRTSQPQLLEIVTRLCKNRV